MAWQDFLRNNSSALLQGGAGLLGGKTASEQAAGGFQGFGAGLQQNKTLKFLETANPELAQAVKSGAMTGGDAAKIYFANKLEAEKPKKPIEVNGRLVDPTTYQVVADFSTPRDPLDQQYKQAQINALNSRSTPASDFEKRKQAATEAGLAPNDPAYQGYLLTGKMPREDQTSLTPTDKKALWAAEDEIPALDNTISSLQRAKELNRKTFTGVTAGARGYLGTNVPGGSYLVDGEAAKATSEFNKTMSMEAIQSMAQTLKGATTDAELERFVNILADPSTSPDIRERTIDRMMALTERVKEVKANRINELRGDGGQSIKGGANPYKNRYGLE